MWRHQRNVATVDEPRPQWPLLLGAGIVVVVVLAELQVIGFALRLAGVSAPAAGVVVVASLAGSVVNLPVVRVRRRGQPAYRLIRVAGAAWWQPIRPPATTITVNVGGALVPIAVSGYLMMRTGRWIDGLVAVLAVTVAAHLAARPLPGIGIALPPLLPGLVAAVTVAVLNPASGAVAVSYVGGTIGTLVGADLTNVAAIRRMPGRVSIGGAGTFDAVFLGGVLAVLLTALL